MFLQSSLEVLIQLRFGIWYTVGVTYNAMWSANVSLQSAGFFLPDDIRANTKNSVSKYRLVPLKFYSFADNNSIPVILFVNFLTLRSIHVLEF